MKLKEKMTVKPSANIKKLALEFAVIVIGVFIALAAETWWSEREDRQFQSDLRDDIMSEFTSNIEILNSDISENIIVYERLKALTSLPESELLALTDNYLNENFGALILFNGFDPVLGSIQALVESGNLTIIDDRELRLLLSEWAGLFKQSQRFTLQAVDLINAQLEPLTAEISSDLVWDDAERRRFLFTLKSFMSMQTIILTNQKDLLESANKILQFIENNPSQ